MKRSGNAAPSAARILGPRPPLAKTRIRVKEDLLSEAAVAWSEASVYRRPDEPQRLLELLAAAHDVRRVRRGLA